MALEIRRINPDLTDELAIFFEAIRVADIDNHFHPHPLTEHEAIRIADYYGRDLYYALVDTDVASRQTTSEHNILGYGILRGWDEGFEIPSLGIALHPQQRSMGLGKMFMHFLHAAARQAGAPSVRLKVYTTNVAALTLYQDLGYLFQEEESGQLVGYKHL